MLGDRGLQVQLLCRWAFRGRSRFAEEGEQGLSLGGRLARPPVGIWVWNRNIRRPRNIRGGVGLFRILSPDG